MTRHTSLSSLQGHGHKPVQVFQQDYKTANGYEITVPQLMPPVRLI